MIGNQPGLGNWEGDGLALGWKGNIWTGTLSSEIPITELEYKYCVKDENSRQIEANPNRRVDHEFFS